MMDVIGDPKHWLFKSTTWIFPVNNINIINFTCDTSQHEYNFQSIFKVVSFISFSKRKAIQYKLTALIWKLLSNYFVSLLLFPFILLKLITLINKFPLRILFILIMNLAWGLKRQLWNFECNNYEVSMDNTLNDRILKKTFTLN
jgi:hypothetical protein